ncbi:glycosyltransferase family 9 protein [Paraburkholderia sp. D1E]|uniref:glycosyltransferase family 9 protein n=1 Tax=Paraburkholderia sp. D1E TaxID=3461398 RepID=UPI004045B15F
MLEFLPAKSKFGGNNPGRVVKMADEARSRQDWVSAASYYQKAYQIRPERLDLLVQFANVSKEAGNYGAAYAAYMKALAATPNDADILLQIGHLLKISGNFRAACDFYSRSADSGDARASLELESLRVVSLDLARDVAQVRLSALHPSDGIDGALVRALTTELLTFDQRRSANSIISIRRLLTGKIENLPEARVFTTLAGLFLELHGDDSHHSARWQSVLAPVDTAIVSDNKVLHDFVEALIADHQVPSDVARRSDTSALKIEEITYDVWDARSAAEKIDQIASSVASFQSFHNQAFLEAYARQRFEHTPWAEIWNRHWQDILVLDVEDERSFVQAWLLRAANAMARDLFLSLRQYWSTPWPAGLVYRLAMAQVGVSIDLRPFGIGERAPHAHVFEKIRTLLSSHPEYEQKHEVIDAVSNALVAIICSRYVHGDATASYVADLVRPQRGMVASVVLRNWLSAANRSFAECRIAGNLLRESGDWTGALTLFRSLSERAGNVYSEVFVDLAITEKTCGNFAEAAECFRRASENNVQREFCISEYLRLLPEVFDGTELKEKILGTASPSELRSIVGDHFINELLYALDDARAEYSGGQVIPEIVESLLPSRSDDTSGLQQAGVRIRRIGSGEVENAGRQLPLCLGVSAVRVDVTSAKEVVACRLRISGRTLCRELAPKPLVKRDASGHVYYEYRFNIWFNVDRLETKGVKTLELYFEEASSGYFTHRTQVVLGTTLSTPESSVLMKDAAALVAERPTQVHSAQRSAFQGPFNRVVFVRPDQLGDAVCSIGGVARIRELFPDAEIVGIVSRSNSGLFRSLGIVDRLVEIDFSYNEISRRRTLSIANQERLIQEFQDTAVDLAIDLSPGADSRPILKLTGARYKVGFSPDRFPWLNLGVEIRASTGANRSQALSQGAMIRSLLEAVSVATSDEVPKMSGRSTAAETLRDLGLESGKYVVLHSGARTESRKWPIQNYIELAEQITSERHVPVVFFADTHEKEWVDAQSLRIGDKFKPLFHLANFEAFDHVLSGAAVFVGNDSGPKHLAAYRGVPTISLHMGAVPWEEWGQEGAGVIMSRWVPCIGCGIELNRECGRGVPCLTGIKAVEVAEQVFRVLD